MEILGESLNPAAHTNDGFFKAIFSQPEYAIAFFRSHLPPAIAAETDWTSLVVLPGSFVKTSLQQVHADLLFSAGLLPFLPKFEYELIDLTRMDPDTAEDDTRIRAVLQLMKLARQRNCCVFSNGSPAFRPANCPITCSA